MHRPLLLAIASLIALASPSSAQWAPTAGPAGAVFHHLAATAGGAVLASSSSGPLLRFDAGTWQTTGIVGTRTVISSGSNVFASDGEALHWSSDSGATFGSQPFSWGTNLVGADGVRVFASRDDTLLTSVDGGLEWQSYAAGAWVTVEMPGQSPVTFPVTLAGFKGAVLEGETVLAAATAYIFGDVFRLSPGDTAWTPVVFRRTSNQEAVTVTDLVRHGDRVFVASDEGVHASADGGETWQDVSAGLAPEHITFGGELLPGAEGLYGHFGTAFYRFDGGSWTLLPEPPGSSFPLAEGAGDRLYVSLLDGVFALGASGWQPLPLAAASTPIPVHAAGLSVLAIAGGALHLTDDAGATWNRLPLGAFTGLAHVGPEAMLAVVNSASGIMRSLDRGQTWTAAARPATPASAGAIVPRRFATAGGATFASYAHQRFGEHGILLSQYGGVFRTPDGGASWVDVSAGLPVAPLGPLPIGVLHSDGEVLLAQTGEAACHRWTGGPWEAVACPAGTIESFAAAGGVWHAVSATGAYVSSDLGETWVPNSAGVELPPDPGQHGAFWRAADLVATPAGVLLVTQYLGESRAYRFGAQWEALSLSFPAGLSWTGFVSGSDHLFGGVRDGGMWSVPLQVVTPASPGPRPLALAVAPPSPNPAAGRVRLTITIPAAGDVSVQVVDMLGRVAAALHAGPAPAGTLSLGLDAGTLAPGTYLVRVIAGSMATSAPLTVVR
jgi:hypothetical protein